MGQSSEMPCKLCLQETKLRHSHILPEFMYKPVYDQRRRAFSTVTTTEGLWNSSTTEDSRVTYHQKGLREYLLCAACEARLSKLESYAKSVLTGPAPRAAEVGGAFTYSDIDYNRFKLFQMSLIWRAGVSTLPVFAKVCLGPHEERLRRYIHAGDPRSANDYGCAMFAVLRDSRLMDSIIVTPNSYKIEGATFYIFLAMGFLWWYPMRTKNIATHYSDLFLKETGTMIVPLKAFEDLPLAIRAVCHAAPLAQLP